MKSAARVCVVLLGVWSVALSQFSEDAFRYSMRGSGVGARAMGMGNAYIGVSDDYTATFWNPAGLAQMRRLEFTGGISNYGVNDDATFFGTKASESTTSTALNNIGFVFPFPTTRGSLVFAFGYNRIADYAGIVSFNGFNPTSSIIPTLYDSDPSYDIPFNTYLTNSNGYTAVQNNVNQNGTIKETGRLGQWAFSGAIDIEENISIGISLNVLTGSYNYTRNYLEADTHNLYANTQAALPADSAYLRFNKFYYDSYIADDLTGGGITIGAMYRADNFRIGLLAKAPTSITVKESYTNSGQSVFDATGSWSGNPPVTTHSYDASNEFGVTSPWTFGLGGSWYFISPLLLAADIEYTDWTQIQWTDNTELEKENVQLQSNFRSTASYRLGAEFDIPKTEVRVRAGYSLTPSPYKGDPSSYDQIVYSAGAGILLQRNVELNVGAAFGAWKSFRNQYSFMGILNASRTDESLSTTNVNVSLSYRF